PLSNSSLHHFAALSHLPPFPTRRSSDLGSAWRQRLDAQGHDRAGDAALAGRQAVVLTAAGERRQRLRRSAVPHRQISPRVPRARDRKSTRLNSSHVKNSYAVFCLKKKKE